MSTDLVTKKNRYNLKYRGTECKNCNHPLDISDKYCPNCSQANSTKKLTLKDFFDEFFSSLISYDSKLLKTLAALLWRPGKITRDYIEGKRVSYTNPFRFLLSLAIVYFLMYSMSADLTSLDKLNNDKNTREVIEEGFNIELNDEEDTAEVMKVLDSLQIIDTIENREKIKQKKDSLILSNPQKHFNSLSKKTLLNKFIAKIKFFKLIREQNDTLTRKEIFDKYDIKENFENKKAFNSLSTFKRLTERPSDFVNDVISKLPFATFFFLPVFAIFIWLAYIRKKYNYTDHLIFSFHNQSLFFILLIISFLIDSIFDTDSNGIFLLIFSIYLFLSMKRFYKQGIVKTILKFIFLNVIFFTLATIGMVILFTGSLFTY